MKRMACSLQLCCQLLNEKTWMIFLFEENQPAFHRKNPCRSLADSTQWQSYYINQKVYNRGRSHSVVCKTVVFVLDNLHPPSAASAGFFMNVLSSKNLLSKGLKNTEPQRSSMQSWVRQNQRNNNSHTKPGLQLSV